MVTCSHLWRLLASWPRCTSLPRELTMISLRCCRNMEQRCAFAFPFWKNVVFGRVVGMKLRNLFRSDSRSMLWTLWVRQLFIERRWLVTSRPASCCWVTGPTPPLCLCRASPLLRWATKLCNRSSTVITALLTFKKMEKTLFFLIITWCMWVLLWQLFFLSFSFPENVPTRNSDVDYRFLEAAKAGDLDTVQVSSLILLPDHSWWVSQRLITVIKSLLYTCKICSTSVPHAH